MPAKNTTATAKTATAKPKAAKAPAKVAAPAKPVAKPVAKASGRTPKRIDPTKAAIVGTAIGIGLHAAGLM